MTVVAARKYADRIEFAADSIVTRGSTQITDRSIDSPKLFQQNGLTIGLTGALAEGSLMQIFTRNHKPASASLEGMIDFLFEFEGWVRNRDTSFTIGNSYLVGFEGKLFRTYPRFDVFEVSEFDAIGAGQDFAITAMHLEKTPTEAVSIACALSVWCSLPVSTIVLNG
jgi:ATP-dependent protease HslVU (ClpYQ) peptidase subunit